MRDSRTARAVPAFVLAMLVSVWLAPAAHAQLGGGLNDAVAGVEDATGSVSDTVGGTVGGVTDGLEGSSGGSGGEGEGESSGGGNGGGLVGGIIGGTKNAVEKTVESGKEGLEEVVKDTGDAFGNIGSETIGGIVGTVEEAVVGATGKNKKSRKSGTEEKPGTTSPTTNGSVVLGKDLPDALRTDGQALTTAINDGRSFAVVSADVPPDESLVTQIGRIATEAARQAAFPLALTLLVIGFLMVQNRLDRKDPKLALAPVDSEHDLLSFT